MTEKERKGFTRLFHAMEATGAMDDAVEKALKHNATPSQIVFDTLEALRNRLFPTEETDVPADSAYAEAFALLAMASDAFETAETSLSESKEEEKH